MAEFVCPTFTGSLARRPHSAFARVWPITYEGRYYSGGNRSLPYLHNSSSFNYSHVPATASDSQRPLNRYGLVNTDTHGRHYTSASELRRLNYIKDPSGNWDFHTTSIDHYGTTYPSRSGKDIYNDTEKCHTLPNLYYDLGNSVGYRNRSSYSHIREAAERPSRMEDARTGVSRNWFDHRLGIHMHTETTYNTPISNDPSTDIATGISRAKRYEPRVMSEVRDNRRPNYTTQSTAAVLSNDERYGARRGVDDVIDNTSQASVSFNKHLGSSDDRAMPKSPVNGYDHLPSSTYTMPDQQKEIMDEKLKEKTEEIENLTRRLSKEMNTKISRNEESLENVSMKNRPVNIATEYENLCSTEWFEAKCELDEQTELDDEDKIEILRCILRTAEQKSSDFLKAVFTKMHKLVSEPVGENSSNAPREVTIMNLSDSFIIEIMDHLRRSADKANLEETVLHVKEATEQKTKATTEILESERMMRYLQATARLTWKMVIQRPAMTFRESGVDETWEESQQAVFWGSCDPADPLALVKYYVHPALYHGDVLMKKGSVYLAKF